LKSIELTNRQERILDIVKNDGPISGEEIASRLSLSRAALRPHLAVLTMSGILNARPRVGYFYAGKSQDTLIAETFRKIKVRDFKSRPIVIRESVSVYDAIVTLFLEDVGTLFVVEDNSILLGVVSRKDFLKCTMGGADLQKMPVGVIMTRMPNIITTTMDESILDVSHKIMEYEVDSLPVVKENKDGSLEVMARVTKTNLARVLVALGDKG
jgi:DeoR family transcriptional regulator, catabolite repression regulator